MKSLVEVLLPNALDHGFDYAVPEGMTLETGDIVYVPISGSETLGVVWGEGASDLPAHKYKSVLSKVENLPPLSEELRNYIRWVAWYNCAALGTVLKMVIPVSDAQTEGRKKLDAYVESIDVSKLQLMPLSEIQHKAAEHFKNKLGHGYSVSLLDGVTGSGKTEVYFDVIAEALKRNDTSQVLVLLPEIALSVQWLARFESRFGVKPVVWNSTITATKRRAYFQAVATGKARVVIGARSALFLPYPHLSLVVVDEEHDTSFKQEEGVIYHARDMAIARASHEKFPVILVSATPSLESIYNVRSGRYREIALPERHAHATMPDIHMLDMRSEPIERGMFLSSRLKEEVGKVIARGHQAMLFLNRRGYAPLVLCRKCGHRFQCPDCSAWMVMHQRKNHPTLQCHHCSYTIPLPKQCPSCQVDDSLHACGPGVERVHEEIAAYLPSARIATLASDNTGSYGELSDIIRAVENKQVDILIGTQMIAKGHHFADLAMVGVVDADLGLAGGDLRAAEKTYQLLHQISGRAGREVVRGHVYLQSYIPDHPVMQALTSGRRADFFAAELQAREQAHMPPYSRLAALIVEGKNEAEVSNFCQTLSRLIQREPSVVIYGPAPAPLAMLRGKYRYRFLIRAERNINLPDYMKQWLAAVKPPRSLKVKIDMDPVSFI